MGFSSWRICLFSLSSHILCSRIKMTVSSQLAPQNVLCSSYHLLRSQYVLSISRQVSLASLSLFLASSSSTCEMELSHQEPGPHYRTCMRGISRASRKGKRVSEVSVPYWPNPQIIRMHICAPTAACAPRSKFRGHETASATVAPVRVQGCPGEPQRQGFPLSYSSYTG